LQTFGSKSIIKKAVGISKKPAPLPLCPKGEDKASGRWSKSPHSRLEIALPSFGRESRAGR